LQFIICGFAFSVFVVHEASSY